MTVQNVGTNRRRYEQHAGASSASPAEHAMQLVPQPMVDGWNCYCSCGAGWFASFYDFDTKEDLLNALSEAHKQHVNGV